MEDENTNRKLCLESTLRMNTPSSLVITHDGKDYEIHIRYEHEKNARREDKTLRVTVYDFPIGKYSPNTPGRDIYADFTSITFLDQPEENRGGVVRGREYHHNKKLEVAFRDLIQPELDKILPRYMRDVMIFLD